MIKVTKEAIVTSPFDAVADSPSEWKDEVKKSFDDMMLTGTGVMDSGNHVATSDIYLPPEQSKSTEPDYDRSIYSSPDAVRWADFYMDTWPNGCSDRDTMIGWFANAMEAMADSQRSEPQEQEWKGVNKNPEHRGMYLTYRPEAPAGSEISTLYFDKAFDRWGGKHEVTHWRNLPEAPAIQSTVERNRTEEIQKMYSIAQELPMPSVDLRQDLQEALRYSDEQVCTALYDAGYRLKDSE